jgi:CRP-like cAMP-binding protein/Tfp pilus assembly protein PilF
MSKSPIPPLDIEELAELARRFADRGMHNEASELFKLALQLDPKNLGFKVALAQVRRLQTQDRNRGERDPRLVVREEARRNAIDAAHFLGLAHLYAEKGEHGRAIECLQVAKAKDLANPAPYKLHGRVLYRRGDFDGAAEEFRRALRFNPFDRETAEQLGRAEYERRQFQAAVAACIDAYLLLHEADAEGADRLRRRIRTLRRALGWDSKRLVEFFHERQEGLRVAFERLEWRRELFREEGETAERGLLHAPAGLRRGQGTIDVATRLRRVELFTHLLDEQIFALTGAVQPEYYEKGALIFSHGSSGADLYLLERGEITIRRPTSYGVFTLGILGPGEVFGEVNFISRYHRSGDAVASQPCELLRFQATDLDRLIVDYPDLGVQLYWCFWHGLAQKLRSTNAQLASFFSSDSNPENFLRLRRGKAAAGGEAQVASSDKIRLFREQGLSGKELEALATFSKEKRFQGGSYIFQEGDPGDEMYIIVEGKARISKFIPGGGEEALAILERGDFFGEMSLIDGQPRSADAKAHGGPLTVLALDQPTVHEVLAMDPQASLDFLRLLCRLVAKRLREIDEKVVSWRIMAGERSESGTA